MPEQKTTRPRPRRTATQQLRALLATEGYRPRRPEPDDDPSKIYFKAEGDTFLMRCSEDDPDFLQICTGYTLENLVQDELALLRAAVDAGNAAKVAKVYLPANLSYVEFQLELFLGGQPLSASLLERCIGALRCTCKEFYRRAQPPAPQAQA